MQNEKPYAVFLKNDVRPDIDSLAKPIAGILGINHIDARIIIRNTRGIFIEKTSGNAAGKIAGTLSERGIEAFTVEYDSIFWVRHPRKAKKMEFAQDGITLKTGLVKKDDISIPIDDIDFMTCGIIATPEFRDYFNDETVKEFFSKFALSQIKDPEVRKETQKKIAQRALQKARNTIDVEATLNQKNLSERDIMRLYNEHTRGMFDILTKEPRQLYRISREDFFFDCLGAELKSNSQDNFKLLSKKLSESAPQALMTEFTRTLPFDQAPDKFIFEDESVFERYNTWFYYMNTKRSGD